MPEFDLRALVREVCDTSDLTAVDDLAKEVLVRISHGDTRTALEQALPRYVRHYLSKDSRPFAHPQPETPLADQQLSDTQKVAVGERPKQKHVRSRKVIGIRSEWQNQLRARVGVGNGVEKWFGDCTREDVQHLSSFRRKLAAANSMAANYLDDIDALMEKLGVRLVRDLPEDAVTGLRGAA